MFGTKRARERRGRPTARLGARARALVLSRRRSFLVLCVATALFGGMVGASSAAPKSPIPGNNGTVKVDDNPFPGDFLPNNEPHVGCSFNIEFFNFDPAVTATATFDLQAPTKGDGSLTRSMKLNSDGEGQMNVSLPSSFFAGAEEHEQQGFHVKLTTHAPMSHGADVKHKVFWVKCAAAAPPSSQPPSITPPSVTPPSVTPPSVTPPSVTPPVQVPPTRPPTEVRGRRFPRPQVKQRVKALAVTGVSLGKLGLAGAGFLAAGLAMIAMSARRRPALAFAGVGRNRWPSSRRAAWRLDQPVPLRFLWRGPPRLPP
jgi:hypothetical protein